MRFYLTSSIKSVDSDLLMISLSYISIHSLWLCKENTFNTARLLALISTDRIWEKHDAELKTMYSPTYLMYVLEASDSWVKATVDGHDDEKTLLFLSLYMTLLFTKKTAIISVSPTEKKKSGLIKPAAEHRRQTSWVVWDKLHENHTFHCISPVT